MQVGVFGNEVQFLLYLDAWFKSYKGCVLVKKSHDIKMIRILLLAEGTSVCKTTGGAVANAKCVFPFTYKGITYQTCTYFGGYIRQPWCATETNAQGGYISKKWGLCEPGCPAEGERWYRDCQVLNLAAKF